MKITPIDDSLSGEWLIDIHPKMQPEMDAGWQRRLNYFTGRNLSHTALITEQSGRGGRLSAFGQVMSHGVVDGLHISVDEGREVFHVSPGSGLMAGGEDVFIPKAMQIEARSLRVYAPVTLLDGSGTTSGTESDTLLSRKLGPTLGELIDDGIDAPVVGILVLQPVAIDTRGEVDDQSPCEEDPLNDAFENWQIADGCRLVYYAWPEEYLSLPVRQLGGTQITNDNWQNRLAYRIFEKEKQISLHPWDSLGVAIGLLGFNPDWSIQFVDRYSVVRDGGKPRNSSLLNIESDNPFMWQARVQQFNQQLSQMTTEKSAELMNEAGFASEAERQSFLKDTIDEISHQFRHLPPVGMLPKQAMNFDTNEHYFFRSEYQVEAVAVPLEQLDIALDASAGLEPFQVNVPDRVRVMVPVPQVWYEAGLLDIAEVADEFQETLDEFLLNRAKQLGRREEVREKSSTLNEAVTGESLTFPDPDPDPDALEADELAGISYTHIPSEDPFGTYLTTDAPIELRSTSVKSLIDDLIAKNLHKIMFDTGDKTADEIESTLYSWLLNAIDPNNVGGGVQDGDKGGLDEFIFKRKKAVNSADDTINLKFLRIQTDIYRLRQIMLGSEDSSRLATSPILASIAKGETALGTKEDLVKFYNNMKIDAGVNTLKRFSSDGGSSEVLIAGDAKSPDSVAVDEAATTIEPSVKFAAAELSAERFVSNDFLLGGSGIGDILLDIDDLDIQKEQQSSGINITSTSFVYNTGIIGEQYRPEYYSWIGQQQAILGLITPIRTTTVAERLKLPASVEAKNAAVATKAEVITEILALEIYVGDISTPGFLETTTNGDGTVTYTEVPKTFDEIEEGNLVSEVISGMHDPVHLDQTILTDVADGKVRLTDADEGEFYSTAVRALENASSMLRLVEARAQNHRNIILMCESKIAEIIKFQNKAKKQLSTIAIDLAESRHDVSVARAILSEEQTRIDGINEHRRMVLSKHVPYLAFYRPRVTDNLQDTPTHLLNPMLLEQPVPKCLDTDVIAPDELNSMIEILRDAPLKWFVNGKDLLKRLKTIEQVNATLEQSKAKAIQSSSGKKYQTTNGYASQKIQGAIFTAMSGMFNIVNSYRQNLAFLDLGKLPVNSWLQNVTQATESVSLSDLIDGKHGDASLSGDAARILENIERISVCLYNNFSQTPTSVRLDWAERLSQYDSPVNLRNLFSLPRWDEVDYLDRQEMQSFVDWLNNQMDEKQTDAIAVVNDIVRVCLLLASHAPVNRIITGSLRKATTVKIGDSVEINVEPSAIKVGMEVFVYSQNVQVAKAVVNNMNAGYSSAKVVYTHQPSVSLSAGSKVHFSQAGKYTGSFV